MNDALDPAAASPDMDYHKTEQTISRYVGSAIHDLRLKHHLTIADIAARADISRSMLSKIENGQTSASLDTLARIAKGLGVSMSSLFRQYDVPEGTAQLIRSGEGMEVVRRGTKRGHTYHLLAYDQGPTKLFEPFLITMNDASETFPTFEHSGTEFIYMLEGEIEYRHGSEYYVLKPGDAFTFQADIPHGPERLIKFPLRFLSITIYPTPGE
jgi:transcriptional regulator with XRE-family HTH domain